MTARRMPGILMVAILLATGTVSADEQPGNIELTPFAGYRVGGDFDDEDGEEVDIDDAGGWGFIANFRAEANTQWEIYYARQSTEFTSGGLFTGTPLVDVDIDYFHGGGTYIVDGGAIRPYVVMTLGASRFAPDGAADLDDETFFSASLGAGLRIAAGERVALRLEGRAFMSFVGGDSRLFCGISGAENICLLEADGSTVTQWQASAGLTLKF